VLPSACKSDVCDHQMFDEPVCLSMLLLLTRLGMCMHRPLNHASLAVAAVVCCRGRSRSRSRSPPNTPHDTDRKAGRSRSSSPSRRSRSRSRTPERRDE